MKNYREERKENGVIILWDDSTNVGLQFNVDEPLTENSCSARLGDNVYPEDIINYQKIASDIFHYAKSKYYSAYEEEKENNKVIIWDCENGVGIQFKEGERLQLYCHSLVIKEPENYCRDEGKLKLLSDIDERLTEYAAERYPKEFAPLNE